MTGLFPSSAFALRSVFAVTIAIKSGKNYNLLDGDLDNGKCRLSPHAWCLLNLVVNQSKDTSCTVSTPGPMNFGGVGFPWYSHNVNCLTTRSPIPLYEPFCTVNKKLILHHKGFTTTSKDHQTVIPHADVVGNIRPLEDTVYPLLPRPGWFGRPRAAGKDSTIWRYNETFQARWDCDLLRCFLSAKQYCYWLVQSLDNPISIWIPNQAREGSILDPWRRHL